MICFSDINEKPAFEIIKGKTLEVSGKRRKASIKQK